MNRKYRKTVIAANWKMNKTVTETKEYAVELRKILPKGRWCDMVICPPAISLSAAVRALKETRVNIGAQNVHALTGGAHTGEISAAMLKDAGAKYVIVGHSERRAMGETDADVVAKVKAAMDAGLTPIVCVGESQTQRELGIMHELVTMQVKAALSSVSETSVRKLIFAYEPIWAIGTGKTASPEQAEEVCELIRTVIRKQFGAKAARAVSILYGGSMNEINAAEILAQPDIDGGLIGSASLDPVKFVQVIEAANQPIEA